MDNSKTIEKAKTLGRLLANSPLSLDLKMTILENLSRMPEKYLDALIVSLENEARGIEIIVKEAETFMAKQDKEWGDLATGQQALADKIVKEELDQLDSEVKITSLRSSLSNI